MTRAEAQRIAKERQDAINRRRTYTARDRNGAEYLEYKIRLLPEQLDRARARLRQLENEAIRLGMRDLLESAA